MDMLHLSIHSSVDVHMDHFHFLAIVNIASVNMSVYVSFQDLAFNYFGLIRS